jgi:hypothetical protein
MDDTGELFPLSVPPLAAAFAAAVRAARAARRPAPSPTPAGLAGAVDDPRPPAAAR